jgi:hypothetical protein
LWVRISQPAVKEYERALALRLALKGVCDPDTAACLNQLAVAHRVAGLAAESGHLFERNPDSPSYASALAIRGSMLLIEKKPSKAEMKLRECLTIRQKNQPDDWPTFDTKAREWPGASSSLREGLEELFTVNRLGLTIALRRCSGTTYPIDDGHSAARDRMRRVKHWQSGEMSPRWTAAPFQAASKGFCRIMGYKELWMPEAVPDERDRDERNPRQADAG